MGSLPTPSASPAFPGLQPRAGTNGTPVTMPNISLPIAGRDTGVLSVGGKSVLKSPLALVAGVIVAVGLPFILLSKKNEPKLLAAPRAWAQPTSVVAKNTEPPASEKNVTLGAAPMKPHDDWPKNVVDSARRPDGTFDPSLLPGAK